jgi:hypothetical protein
MEKKTIHLLYFIVELVTQLVMTVTTYLYQVTFQMNYSNWRRNIICIQSYDLGEPSLPPSWLKNNMKESCVLWVCSPRQNTYIKNNEIT